MRPLWTADSPDIVSEVVRVLEIAGSVQVRALASGTWGVHFAAGPPALFHVVEHGECWVRVPERALVHLVPGEVVIVKAGVAHDIVSSPNGPTSRSVSPAERPLYRTVSYHLGRGRPECTFVCGAMHFGGSAQHPLLTLLPEVLHVAADDALDAVALLRQMDREASDGRLGSDLIVRRLSDIFFVQILRGWFDSQPVGGGGWLAAARDVQIGAALRAIHTDPSRHWSVSTLAHESALSRSSFAERFARMCGEPPMHYVTRWRVLLAMASLRNGHQTVASIAGSVGYASVAAFVRAFTRMMGVSPSTYRRHARRTSQ